MGILGPKLAKDAKGDPHPLQLRCPLNAFSCFQPFQLTFSAMSTRHKMSRSVSCFIGRQKKVSLCPVAPIILPEAEQERKARRRPISGRGAETLLLWNRYVRNSHLQTHHCFSSCGKFEGKKTTTEKKVVVVKGVNRICSANCRRDFKGGRPRRRRWMKMREDANYQLSRFQILRGFAVAGFRVTGAGLGS